MLASQIHVGKASLLQPKSKIRLDCGASVDILADASLTNSSAVSSLFVFESDHWATARNVLLVSFTISFAENISIGSRQLFIQQFGQTLSGAKLFSQLQLQTELKAQNPDPATCLHEPVCFSLELRRQVQPHRNRHAEIPSHQPQVLSGIENVKQPLRVPTTLLCSVNVSLTFSQRRSITLVPQKRNRSTSDGYLDPWDEFSHARDSTLGTLPYAQQQNIYKEQCAHTQYFPIRTFPNYVLGASGETLNVFEEADSMDTPVDPYRYVRGYEADDTESLVFSSQGSTLQPSQESQLSVASDFASSPDIDAMITLVDAGFRNLICPKPIGTAPGIKIDELDIGTRLVDVAPSVFSPGYAAAVATRASLVPTIARFLTSFVQKADNPLARTKNTDLVRQISKMKFDTRVDNTHEISNQGERLKEVIKSHLWMTMSNGLRDPEPARRLKALHSSTRQVPDHVDMLHDQEADRGHCQKHQNILYYDLSEAERGTRSGPNFEEKGTHDDMLDIFDYHQADTGSDILLDCYEGDDDEEGGGGGGGDDDEFDTNLFEVHEENLMNNISTAVTPDPEPLRRMDQQHTIAGMPPKGQSTVPHLSSPMLEYPAVSPKPSATPQTASGSPPARFWLEVPPTSTPPRLPSNNDVDDNASLCGQLLEEDEQSRVNFRVATVGEAEGMTLAQIGHSKTNDGNDVDEWEPDFEQWEFDAEDGCDDLLF